ncbi:hypothetical protein KHP57_09400 [Algiphilus sp. NNCM1]|uniref:DUF6588 family protein n=1 Tax=Algiphilus sp. TaxID=1872431 RepID=UPI001CA64359|nr:DUF6588 family protein [Algiphilus sp.]MBY8965920.1 hypothetical protein [Algiphilus acroporae]MCI5102415.1 hypothetical protein [Algiphilus sp.]
MSIRNAARSGGWCALMALFISPWVAANDFALQSGAAASDVRQMSEDLAAATSYKALGPAEAFGLIGTGIGAFAGYMATDDEDAWQRASGKRVGDITTAGLRARKGLPLGIDVSAFYADVIDTDGALFGGALQYALWEGGVATPGVALRLGYSQLTGVDDFDYDTWSVDATVSKGFAMLTPYAGVGYVTGELDPSDASIDAERVNNGRFFAGLRLSLGLIDITPEIEQNGDNFVTNLRLGMTL